MPSLPCIDPLARSRATRDGAVVFAVYAPFGTDPVLSQYPEMDRPQARILKQTLVQNLQRVAAEGVNVSALIDLYEDDSYLVEIPAGKPQALQVNSAWKQNMSAPQALAGFLRRTAQRFPGCTVVLALEGHGGGFVPDIDPTRITPSSSSNWSQGGTNGKVSWTQSEQGSGFEAEPGSPALPMDMPILPMDMPILPISPMPMSTWGLGHALQSAIKSGVPRPAVIHFNNCFNASLELLHTVAPYADVAAAYANYDFFTAGAAYPAVFKKLRLAGSASREQLARWFALENQAELAKQPGHPTVGAVVPLARLRKRVSPALDALSQALIAALQASRADARQRIRQAATQAQHYDTVPGFELKVPDQFMDLGSFAAALQLSFEPGPVRSAAAALQAELSGLHVYGDVGSPSMAKDPAVVYDFSNKLLGLSVFFPDPDLSGQWDWRSPYYLSGVPQDPANPQPPAQRHVIDFLSDPAPGKKQPWVQFIQEYHLAVPFRGFHAIQPLLFPLANPKRRGDKPTGGNPSTGPNNGPGSSPGKARPTGKGR